MGRGIGVVTMMWYGWGAGNWLVMSVVVLILSTLVVAGVIWLGRGGRHAPTSAADAARQTHEERLAGGEIRGEINEQEHSQRRDLPAPEDRSHSSSGASYRDRSGRWPRRQIGRRVRRGQPHVHHARQ